MRKQKQSQQLNTHQQQTHQQMQGVVKDYPPNSGTWTPTSFTSGQALNNISVKDTYIVKVNGHEVEYTEYTYECLDCDFKKEIPQIIVESGGDILQVYKMFLLGQIADVPCFSEEDIENHSDPLNKEDNILNVDSSKVMFTEKDVKAELKDQMLSVYSDQKT